MRGRGRLQLMLLYGDVERREDPRAKLDHIQAITRRMADAPAGVGRHALITGALIEAGELLQGLADAQFRARGCDAASPLQDAAMRLCLDLARTMRMSWSSGFAAPPEPPLDAAAALATHLDGEMICTRLAEGYAFYALYPEAYLQAALDVGRTPGARVIGLRSIGAGLAAAVACGLDASAPPVTARPTGDPFQRRLELDPELLAEIAGPAPVYAIVDEGPGLSGSSFAAAMEVLEHAGVEASRIRLFPSHRGPPGPKASPAVLRRWTSAEKGVVEFDELALRPGARARRLEAWAAELVGEPLEPLRDLSAGAWRAAIFEDEADWPPTFPAQERRKFLMRAASGTWLLKFVGLGTEGKRKLERARKLQTLGFGPQTAGLAHGFLVQRWIGEARPLDLRRSRPPGLLQTVGAFLAALARSFPASGGGASPERLLEMIRANAAEVLGEAAARKTAAWSGRLDRLARAMAPVDIDGRMHAFEWLQRPDGTLIKADALDHHCAHDLVGRQDIAWDVAGAVLELGLTEDEAGALARRAGTSDGVLGFMRLAYPAFQLGRSAEAARISGSQEAARLRRAAEIYAAELDRRLCLPA